MPKGFLLLPVKGRMFHGFHDVCLLLWYVECFQRSQVFHQFQTAVGNDILHFMWIFGITPRNGEHQTIVFCIYLLHQCFPFLLAFVYRQKRCRPIILSTSICMAHLAHFYYPIKIHSAYITYPSYSCTNSITRAQTVLVMPFFSFN